MFRFGILSHEQYARLGRRRRYSGSRVAFNLLDLEHEHEDPTEADIRMFEDISYTMELSNGTCRTTFRKRLEDVDVTSLQWMSELFPVERRLQVQDRAASHALTSWEWAHRLFPVFPKAELEASDLILELVELTLENGSRYILEPDGTPLQYIKAPFVVSLTHPESWRYPLNRWIAARARRRLHTLEASKRGISPGQDGPFRTRTVRYVHPYATALEGTDRRFTVRRRSVFDATPGTCDVVRTMNILNPSYFSKEQLAAGVAASFGTLRPGGLWIVGRTIADGLTNDASFLRRGERGWEVLDRIGKGSEIENLALTFLASS